MKQTNHKRREAAEAGNGLSRALHQLTPPAKPDDGTEDLPIAEQVEELAFKGVAPAAIAILVGCSPSQLANKFAADLARGRARQQEFLLGKLAERVDLGEWPATRFALKNFCGLSDNPVVVNPIAEEPCPSVAVSDAPKAKTPEAEGAAPPAPARPRRRYPQRVKRGGQDAITGIAG